MYCAQTHKRKGTMGFLKRHADQVETPDGVHQKQEGSHTAATRPATEQRITFLACWLGLVASIGGFMFGYVRYVWPFPLFPC